MNGKLLLFVFLLLVISGLEIFCGSVYQQFLAGNKSVAYDIILNFRLIRTFNALVAGASLALVGLILQTLFRNPLAGPYILGISSGAAFGVALAVLLPAKEIIFGYFASITFSLLGSLIVLGVILFLSYRYSLTVVIISGVLITGFFSAMINILQFLANASAVKSFVMWTLASVDYGRYWQVFILFVIFLAVYIFVYVRSEAIDTLYLGQEYAMILGVNIRKLALWLLLLSSILTAIITAWYGPIAFVGVISPHIARLISDSLKHKTLVLHTILIGSIIVLLADFLSHNIAPINLPLNTTLSLIGLPVLMYLLIRSKYIQL